MVTYIPERGDIVWFEFSPQAGHEQKGRRPALVVSSRIFNKSGLVILCPITSKVKGHPFEVPIAAGKINGCVLAHHVKSQDWRARHIQFIARAPQAVTAQTQRYACMLMVE